MDLNFIIFSYLFSFLFRSIPGRCWHRLGRRYGCTDGIRVLPFEGIKAHRGQGGGVFIGLADLIFLEEWMQSERLHAIKRAPFGRFLRQDDIFLLLMFGPGPVTDPIAVFGGYAEESMSKKKNEIYVEQQQKPLSVDDVRRKNSVPPQTDVQGAFPRQHRLYFFPEPLVGVEQFFDPEAVAQRQLRIEGGRDVGGRQRHPGVAEQVPQLRAVELDTHMYLGRGSMLVLWGVEEPLAWKFDAGEVPEEVDGSPKEGERAVQQFLGGSEPEVLGHVGLGGDGLRPGIGIEGAGEGNASALVAVGGWLEVVPFVGMAVVSLAGGRLGVVVVGVGEVAEGYLHDPQDLVLVPADADGIVIHDLEAEHGAGGGLDGEGEGLAPPGARPPPDGAEGGGAVAGAHGEAVRGGELYVVDVSGEGGPDIGVALTAGVESGQRQGLDDLHREAAHGHAEARAEEFFPVGELSLLADPEGLAGRVAFSSDGREALAGLGAVEVHHARAPVAHARFFPSLDEHEGAAVGTDAAMTLSTVMSPGQERKSNVTHFAAGGIDPLGDGPVVEFCRVFFLLEGPLWIGTEGHHSCIRTCLHCLDDGIHFVMVAAADRQIFPGIVVGTGEFLLIWIGAKRPGVIGRKLAGRFVGVSIESRVVRRTFVIFSFILFEKGEFMIIVEEICAAEISFVFQSSKKTAAF
mmetsp:Transcript_14596/g.32180  ORF Transcript_14596/g.32180 Transcript_14596/m.32180 type:complete len:686 (+) Transcript_14596:1005-3062(+)